MTDFISCPMYVDYVRECAIHMDSLTREIDTTLRFCTSGDYADCPFYRFIKEPETACPFFKSCRLCNRYKNHHIDDFVELTQKWCLSDFQSCARYKTRNEGKIPDINLLPDGSTASS